MDTAMEADAPTVPLSGNTHAVPVYGGRIDSLDDGGSVQVGAERLLLGRARRCDLVLDDTTVSAVHAEVQATPNGVRLVDLTSRNGTFVGEVQVSEGYLAGPCDFRCGARRLRFVPETHPNLVVGGVHRFGGLVGTTPEMLELFGILRRFAPSPVSIVIRGETGTGKERVARAIHEASPRRRRPFLAVNCAAMPDALLEAELLAPYFIATPSFRSSPCASPVTALLPMFALTLHDRATPIPIGSRFTWFTFAGMTSRPRATSLRTSSGATRSRSATWAISSVTTPRRA